jgi:hypothetical protein
LSWERVQRDRSGGTTVRLAEGGPDDRQAVAAAGRLPVPADLAVRADHVVGVVVDGEAGQVERLLVAGLPAGVGWQRTDQLDAVVVGGGKDLPDADRARVDQMDIGQQVHDGEVGVPVGHGVQVGGGGVGGGHVGDQVGRSGSQVSVTWPCRRARRGRV